MLVFLRFPFIKPLSHNVRRRFQNESGDGGAAVVRVYEIGIPGLLYEFHEGFAEPSSCQFALLLSGLHHVKGVHIPLIDIDSGFHSRFLQIPDIGERFFIEWLSVHDEGIACRKSRVVRFPGRGRIFADGSRPGKHRGACHALHVDSSYHEPSAVDPQDTGNRAGRLFRREDFHLHMSSAGFDADRAGLEGLPAAR